MPVSEKVCADIFSVLNFTENKVFLKRESSLTPPLPPYVVYTLPSDIG